MKTINLKMLILLALTALTLAGCGGGGGGENLPINNPGGGGTSNGFDGLDPNIVIPAAESFVEHSTSGDTAAQRWVKNLYNTIPAPGSATRVYQNASLTSWADQIYNAVNVQRQLNGRAPLTRLEPLEWLAQSHARDMGLRNFFDHNNADGMTPWDRLNAIQPAPYIHAGENAAKGQENIEELMAQWMASEKHRKNILSPDYTHMGVGVYLDPGDKATPTNFIQFFASFQGQTPASHNWLRPGR
jgi:uncharacterized protein YkwD